MDIFAANDYEAPAPCRVRKVVGSGALLIRHRLAAIRQNLVRRQAQSHAST